MAARAYRQARYRRPPGATEVLLVRHGESEPAVDGRPFPMVDGHGDPDLAPEGRAQARRVADRLAGAGIDAIYVTTLRRTAATAAPLAERLALVPRVEPDLREVHLGEWEGGLFRRKVAEGDPVARRMLELGRWDVVPGAEPQEVFAARVEAGLRRIVAAHPDARVVAVVHGGVVGQAVALATGGRPFAFTGADNGSITHLVAEAGGWVLRRFNDTAHLDADLDVVPEPPSG